MNRVVPNIGLIQRPKDYNYFRRRHLKKPFQNNAKEDPPPSAAGFAILTDVSVQTEEKEVFYIYKKSITKV